MFTIKLKVSKFNSTFVTKASSESEALREMLRAIKQVFGPCKFKVLDIKGIRTAKAIEMKDTAERMDEWKMLSRQWKKFNTK